VSFVLILICTNSYSAIITADVTGGDWSLGTTWVGGVIPTNADDVIIPAGVTVTTPSLHSNQFASLEVSGTLNIAGVFTIKEWATDYITIKDNGTLLVGSNITISDNSLGLFTIESGGIVKVVGNVTVGNVHYQFDNYGFMEVTGSILGTNMTFNNFLNASLLVHSNITGTNANFWFNNFGIVTVDNDLTMKNVVVNNEITGKLIVYGDLTLEGSGSYNNKGFVQSNNFYLINLTAFENTGTTVVLEEFNVSWNGCPCNEGNWYLNTLYLANPGATSCDATPDCAAHWGGVGSIANGRRLWLNAGFTGYGQPNDNELIYQWFDLANTFGFKMHEENIANQPRIDNNATNNINYNPVMCFEASDVHFDLDSNYLFAPNSDGGMAVFAVTTPEPNSSTDQLVFDFGLYKTDGYGLIHSASDIKTYTASSDGGNENTYANAYGNASLLIEQTTEWSGNQILYVNGTPVDTKTITLDSLTGYNVDSSATAVDGVSGPFTLGGSSTNPLNYDYNGKIAELIVYAHLPSNDILNSTESFLALKYGISLKQDYTDLNFNTIYTYDATYNNGIVGLAREDLNLVHQKITAATGSDENLTVSVDSVFHEFDQRQMDSLIAVNSSYIVWGHDGSASNAGRIYKVQTTNFNQEITLQFTFSGLATLPDLEVDTDPSFGSATTVTATKYDGDKLCFQHTFSNNSVEYFRIAALVIPPRIPGVGINTEAIDTSAILHIESTDKGILLPNLTDAQMNAIVSPPKGLIVYNTDTKRYMYNAGDDITPTWQFIGGVQLNTSAELTAQNGNFNGEIRYNTTTDTLWFWNGTAWNELKDAP